MQLTNRSDVACELCRSYHHGILYVAQHVAMLHMITLDTCLLTSIFCLQDPLSEPNWSLSIRRSQVVNALESALCILSDAEEAWLAWRHASSQTETQLRRLFRSGQQQHNVHEQVCPPHIWYWSLLPCCRLRQYLAWAFLGVCFITTVIGHCFFAAECGSYLCMRLSFARCQRPSGGHALHHMFNVFATYQCIHCMLHFALTHLVLFVFIHKIDFTVIWKWLQHPWVCAAVSDQPAAMAERL